MRRRTFLGLAAALGVASATDACGVPSSSNPIRLGNAPTPGPPDAAAQTPRAAHEASNQRDLVEYFLNAAAGANTVGGDRPDALHQAQDRMRDFFTPEGAARWQPGLKVLVVRADILPTVLAEDLTWTVGVVCTPLGYLDDHGDVAPVPNVPFRVTFTVVSVGAVGNAGQWRIKALDRPDDAPPDLLLAENALANWYEQLPTYFWDPDSPNLVPELRYMPKAISEAKQPAEIVRWLTAGPSSWLNNVLKPLPQEIEVKETIPDPGGLHLMLNLSSKAASLHPDIQRNFAIQVWWMRQRGTVELAIEGASTGIKVDGGVALGSNPAARADDRAQVKRFGIVEEKVRELADQQQPQQPQPPPQPPLLTTTGNPNPNTQVVLAAVTRDKLNGALVRHDGNQFKLWTGSVIGKDDVTGKSGGQTARYVPTAVVGKKFSRPVWIRKPSALVMVVVDNVLMTVKPGIPDAPGVPVNLPRGLVGPVSAVSVAPDGRRIALIAGGQVIVAPMIFSDLYPVGISDTFRTIYTPLRSQVAVGWGDVVSLVIGGAPAPTTSDSLLMVPLSSAVQVPRPAESRGVDQISSYPDNANPDSNGQGPLIVIQSTNQAFNVYQDRLGPISITDSSTGSTPSASPSAGTAPPATVSSPFFAD